MSSRDGPAADDPGGADDAPGGPSSQDGGADGDGPGTQTGGVLARLEGLPLGHDRVLQALVGIVLVGLLLRLLFLGDRVAHFDEGRVAYWAHYSMETGSFAYRRIIHGPLLQHVDRWLFALIGPTDFVMRLPVALLGAVLPLSALLFRRHLRELEVLILGAFLAFNPVLLYYSRFMRSDLLVAAFMFVGLGLVVRYYDTRRPRYLYLASAAAALGFGAKENAVVYLLVWVGAAALLADQALYRPRNEDSGGQLLWSKARGLGDRVRGEADEFWDTALAVVGTGFWVVLIFGVVSIVIYAPRGAGLAGLRVPPPGPGAGPVGLWQALSNPLLVPELIDHTVSHTVAEFSEWFGAASEPGCHKDNVIDGWVCYTGRFLEVLATKAAPLSLFAVGGFLYERYARARTRNLVMFMSYAGFVAVVGYPLGTDVWGAWLTIHALVPLAIPAAAGLGVIVTWGREAVSAEDQVGVAIAAVILLVIAAMTGAVVLTSVYANDQSADNTLVQFAQPADDAKPALNALATVSERTEGPHLLIYYGQEGDSFVERESMVQQREADFERSGLAFRPLCTRFHNSLPLPWYLAREDVDTTCERDRGDFAERLATDPPPVVITSDSDATVPTSALEESYVARTYRWRTYTRETTFWFHEEYAEALPDR